MGLRECERHLIGQLCWHCHEATRPSHERRRRCPARRKWSYERRRIRCELLKAFCFATTARHAARTIGCSYPTACRAFTDGRKAMARPAAEAKRPLLGELGLDESYFGGKRKGKRGRGAAGKVAVFGVLERDGKAFTVAVPDCQEEALMAELEATVKGSAFDTDEFTGYNDLSRYGKHVPIDHRQEFADGEAHIDGIEGFWSFAKRLHRPCHGVDRDNFPTYLVEYEFRDNHRGDHLPTILFDALILPQLRKGGLA